VLIATESGESDQDCTATAADFVRNGIRRKSCQLAAAKLVAPSYGIRRKGSELAAAKLAARCFGIVRPKGNGKISPIKKPLDFPRV